MISNKKIIVVTGAGRGLGRALAKTLAGPDTIIVLCGRDTQELEIVAGEIQKDGNECQWQKTDVTKKEDIESLIMGVHKKFGRVDMCINNAGAVHKAHPLEEISDEEYEACMKTNVDGVFYMLRSVIPIMKQRGSGTIIAVASTAGRRGNPEFAAYATSKFAVRGLMQSAARSLCPLGIRCLTISPAGINTAMREFILGKEDAQKQQSPETVAQLIKKVTEREIEAPECAELEIRNGEITSTEALV